MKQFYYYLRTIILINILLQEVDRKVTASPSRKSNSSFRVIGGTATDAEKYYPWYLKLRIQFPGEYGWYTCGSTIIDPGWILTAAHCITKAVEMVVDGHVIEKNLIFEGTKFELVRKKNFRLARFSLDDVFIHKKYINMFNYTEDYLSLKNDIALIHSPVIEYKTKWFPSKFRKIPLDENGYFSKEQNFNNCELIGRGHDETGKSSDKLQRTDITVWSNAYCRRFWGNEITDKKVCAGNGKHKSCRGDSGGPLSCKKGGRNYLVGVSSYGSNLCTFDVPSVFGRVSEYVDWIRNIQNGNYEERFSEYNDNSDD